MAVIEVVTFRLAPGVDEDEFLDADHGLPDRVPLPSSRACCDAPRHGLSAANGWW